MSLIVSQNMSTTAASPASAPARPPLADTYRTMACDCTIFRPGCDIHTRAHAQHSLYHRIV